MPNFQGQSCYNCVNHTRDIKVPASVGSTRHKSSLPPHQGANHKFCNRWFIVPLSTGDISTLPSLMVG